jgi:hypothetical protein
MHHEQNRKVRWGILTVLPKRFVVYLIYFLIEYSFEQSSLYSVVNLVNQPIRPLCRSNCPIGNYVQRALWPIKGSQDILTRDPREGSRSIRSFSLWERCMLKTFDILNEESCRPPVDGDWYFIPLNTSLSFVCFRIHSSVGKCQERSTKWKFHRGLSVTGRNCGEKTPQYHAPERRIRAR